MEQGARVLQSVVAAGFLGLGIVAVRAAVRRPHPRMRSLAIALGLLGMLPTIGLLRAHLPGDADEAVARAGIVLFAASGYALLAFRHRLIPLPRLVRRGLATATVASTAAALASGLLPGNPRGTVQLVAVGSVALVWLASVGEPTWRFWRASAGRPIVQSARLRALSAAYFGVIFVALTSQASNRHPSLLLAGQIVIALVIPLLWVALHPPAWLRRSWQSRERISRASVNALVRHVGDESSLAERGLIWGRALVGGDGGAIIDAHGRVLAIDGISEDQARAAAAHAPHADTGLLDDGEGGLVVAPIPLESGTGCMIVKSGPLSPLFDLHEAGELAAFSATLAIALDRVRTLERHRSQSEHYAGVVQAMSDLDEGFMVTDGRRLVFANDAYCRITGYSLEELLALASLDTLAPPDEFERLTQRRLARMNGGPVVDHFESAMIRKDGERVELEVSMKILGTADRPSIVSIIRDITERKRAEDRLRAALEREHEAVRRLESLDDMKNAFLSAVSHELRTPLTGVLGFARTLQSLGDTMSDQDRMLVVTRLNRNAEKLDRLLSDLLDLDRLSRGIIEPKRRPVDLASLVQGVIREFPAPATHEIITDIEPVITDVDQAQIERVVENLLTNAVRHTTDGTTIWVSVQESPDGGMIIVEDTGPGVPEHLKREIFEPFRQGPSLHAHSPGVGIGLALVRRFVDLHGGTVEVSGRAGGGASFRVHLPRTPAPSGPATKRGLVRPAKQPAPPAGVA